MLDVSYTATQTYWLATRPRAIIACLVVSNHVEQHTLTLHQPRSPATRISTPVLPSQIPLAHPSPLPVLTSIVVALVWVWYWRNCEVLLVQGPVGCGQGKHEEHRPEPHRASIWSRRLSLHGAAGRHLGPVSGVKAATCAPSKPNTHLHSPGIPRGQIPIRQIQELILDPNATTEGNGR